jgi:hypothetical protein
MDNDMIATKWLSSQLESPKLRNDRIAQTAFLQGILTEIQSGRRFKFYAYTKGFFFISELVFTDVSRNPSVFKAIGYTLLSVLVLPIAPVAAGDLMDVIFYNLQGGNDVTDELRERCRARLPSP